MRMNESDDRQFSDDKLYSYLFQYLKGNREIRYDSIQQDMINKKMLEEDPGSYSSHRILLHGSDFKRILELYWELMRRNLIIPAIKDSYEGFDIPFQYRITEEGKKFFNLESPTPYADFMTNKVELVKEPTLISHQREKIIDAISFYEVIKEEIEKQPNLNEEEKHFLIKEYFHKVWTGGE